MFRRHFALVLLLLAFASCKNDLDQFTPDPFNPGPDPEQIVFNASTFVEVVDIDGTPLEDVMINVNT